MLRPIPGVKSEQSLLKEKEKEEAMPIGMPMGMSMGDHASGCKPPEWWRIDLPGVPVTAIIISFFAAVILMMKGSIDAYALGTKLETSARCHTMKTSPDAFCFSTAREDHAEWLLRGALGIQCCGANVSTTTSETLKTSASGLPQDALGELASSGCTPNVFKPKLGTNDITGPAHPYFIDAADWAGAVTMLLAGIMCGDVSDVYTTNYQQTLRLLCQGEESLGVSMDKTMCGAPDNPHHWLYGLGGAVYRADAGVMRDNPDAFIDLLISLQLMARPANPSSDLQSGVDATQPMIVQSSSPGFEPGARDVTITLGFLQNQKPIRMWLVLQNGTSRAESGGCTARHWEQACELVAKRFNMTNVKCGLPCAGPSPTWHLHRQLARNLYWCSRGLRADQVDAYIAQRQNVETLGVVYKQGCENAFMGAMCVAWYCGDLHVAMSVYTGIVGFFIAAGVGGVGLSVYLLCALGVGYARAVVRERRRHRREQAGFTEMSRSRRRRNSLSLAATEDK